MQLTVTPHDGYTLAQTSGPIDETARELLRQHLHPLVGSAGGRVVIDLSQSPRINSQGLADLVTLAAHANTSGSCIVFFGMTPFVSVVLTKTKLDAFFQLAPDLPAAVKRCQQKSVPPAAF